MNRLGDGVPKRWLGRGEVAHDVAETCRVIDDDLHDQRAPAGFGKHPPDPETLKVGVFELPTQGHVQPPLNLAAHLQCFRVEAVASTISEVGVGERGRIIASGSTTWLTTPFPVGFHRVVALNAGASMRTHSVVRRVRARPLHSTRGEGRVYAVTPSLRGWKSEARHRTAWNKGLHDRASSLRCVLVSPAPATPVKLGAEHGAVKARSMRVASVFGATLARHSATSGGLEPADGAS